MPAPLLLHHLGNCWSNKYLSKIFHNMSHSITMANIPRKDRNYCKLLYFFLSLCPLLRNQNKTESPPAHLSQISTRTFYFVENSDFCCWFQMISSSDGAPSLMRDQICPRQNLVIHRQERALKTRHWRGSRWNLYQDEKRVMSTFNVRWRKYWSIEYIEIDVSPQLKMI